MRFTIIGLACALAVTSAALAEDKCPPLKIVSSVDLTIHKQGAIGVPVAIGQQKAMFLLSTGAAQSSISTALSEQLQLPTRHTGAVVVNQRGNFSDEIATAKDFYIGNVHYGSVYLRLMIETPGPKGPQGILAADLFRNYDVELDFLAAKMNLISRDHCEGSAVYWPSKTIAKIPMRVTDDNRIVFKMTLDGHEVETSIDVAATRTILTQDVASELFGIEEGSPGSTPVKNGVYRHRFNTLSAEGLAIKNSDVLIVPTPGSHMPGAISRGRGRQQVELGTHKLPPLRLGMSTLRQLHIYIDYHNQTLYFTPAKPDATSAEEPPAE
jgi:hypothetical protein